MTDLLYTLAMACIVSILLMLADGIRTEGLALFAGPRVLKSALQTGALILFASVVWPALLALKG